MATDSPSAKEAANCSFPHTSNTSTCPKHDRIWRYVTSLMDRLSLDPLINPCSMACSSPVTITPCACCHPAVLCLQSYSVHLSGTIYGKQFVVYHGTFSFLRSSFLCFSVFVARGRVSWTISFSKCENRLSPAPVICFVPRWVEGLQAPFWGFRLSEKCIVSELRTRLFSSVSEVRGFRGS